MKFRYYLSTSDKVKLSSTALPMLDWVLLL